MKKITEKQLLKTIKGIILQEARKSSATFRRVITYDNSMGDYNHLAFDFIDKMKLQKEFERFLIDYMGEDYKPRKRK